MGMRLWKAFFPAAEAIVGVDIGKEHSKKEGVYRIYQGDQADPMFLQTLAALEGPFDFIIDDGGHMYHQQVTTFRELFPYALKPGGLLAIEDIEASYYRGQHMYDVLICGGLAAPNTTVEWSRQLAYKMALDAGSVGPEQVPELPLQHLLETAPLVDAIYYGSNIIAMQRSHAPLPPPAPAGPAA
eukprot:NODE_3205_length_693_cov_194.107143_g2275_i0.p1 GENE.NODE_3205_length_693_cov_194.107143_g2275_i0~~NODE_3205_length_693_cov_194.107143_g2275_i0.p1  ORF type:complete len:195 (+),score=75.77 NODE_3205_length_693_cov_194.107143_g2275_i0:31-585(+)